MRKYKFTDSDDDEDIIIVETRWLRDAKRKLKRVINERYSDNGPIIDDVGRCFSVGIKHEAYIDSIVSGYLKNIEVIDD